MRLLTFMAVMIAGASSLSSLSAADGEGGAFDPATIKTFTPYPLDVCVVSDEPLGSMGDSLSFVYQGQEITICCKGCTKKFAKKPAHFIAKLSKLAAAAKAEEAKKTGNEQHDHGHHGDAHGGHKH